MSGQHLGIRVTCSDTAEPSCRTWTSAWPCSARARCDPRHPFSIRNGFRVPLGSGGSGGTSSWCVSRTGWDWGNGMIIFIVTGWIIPSRSLRETHQKWKVKIMKMDSADMLLMSFLQCPSRSLFVRLFGSTLRWSTDKD